MNIFDKTINYILNYDDKITKVDEENSRCLVFNIVSLSVNVKLRLVSTMEFFGSYSYFGNGVLIFLMIFEMSRPLRR